MPKAAIALGSNLGHREQNLLDAVERIGGIGRVCAVSAFIDTAPVGYLDQPRFLNGVVLIETRLHAEDLMEELLRIERSMGRIREGVPAKGPRLVDLDMIFYDDLVLRSPGLTLPHPAMQDRAFVLKPLAEVAPEWVHPILGKTAQALLSGIKQEAG